LGVKASLEKNRSAAVILEQYNKSLETASNIKSKLADCCMKLAVMQASNAPLDQLQPLLELVEDLCNTAEKTFKASAKLKEHVDALNLEWHCNQIKECLDEEHHQKEQEERIGAIMNGEEN
jgi:hypothetical protein